MRQGVSAPTGVGLHSPRYEAASGGVGVVPTWRAGEASPAGRPAPTLPYGRRAGDACARVVSRPRTAYEDMRIGSYEDTAVTGVTEKVVPIRFETRQEAKVTNRLQILRLDRHEEHLRLLS